VQMPDHHTWLLLANEHPEGTDPPLTKGACSTSNAPNQVASHGPQHPE
jgi:hypothetical protein